jgi:hypothetical protein
MKIGVSYEQYTFFRPPSSDLFKTRSRLRLDPAKNARSPLSPQPSISITSFQRGGGLGGVQPLDPSFRLVTRF